MRFIRESAHYKRLVAWTKQHERAFVLFMLLGGFSADVIQYSALDIREKFLVSGLYLATAIGSLILITYPRSLELRFVRGLRVAAPFAHQFALGGILSTALLFYWFSGSVSSSWPILLLLVVLMGLNEFLRKHFLHLTVQIAVLNFCLISLCAVAFAYLFNSVEASVFIGAVVTSTLASFALIALFHRVGSRESWRTLSLTVLAVSVLMGVAYFGNVIPPIPLAIRDAGMYTRVASGNPEYVREGPTESWWQQLIPGQTFTIPATQPLFAYTAVFAPTDSSTTIVHRWQQYDEEARSWLTRDMLSYTITGGRQNGYRGYTFKSRFSEGRWRVSVETVRGQVLGRIPFTVIHTE